MTIEPGFTERLIDSDNDGLADKLELTVTVTAKKTVTCDFVGYLVDSTGKEIDVAGPDVTLAVGTNELALDFDGPTIFKSGQSGPYRLVKVALDDAYSSPYVTVASAADMSPTKPYDYHIFQH